MAPTDHPHIPRVAAELVDGQLWVRCPWCKAWHFHGAGDPGDGREYPRYGHRVEHCHRDNGPYAKYGYWLVPVGEG